MIGRHPQTPARTDQLFALDLLSISEVRGEHHRKVYFAGDELELDVGTIDFKELDDDTGKDAPKAGEWRHFLNLQCGKLGRKSSC